MESLYILPGLILLSFGADWLVAGASRLALGLRVPQLIVGLTVVAFGTSAPEVVVGVQAALEGHGALALGNVIGSNVANLGLILGVTALVKPARVDGELRRREVPVLLASTLALPAVLWDGALSRVEGAALLAVALAYTAVTVARARSAAVIAEATSRAEVTAAAAEGSVIEAPSRARNAALALAGLGGLLVGGHAFILGATALARAWGMSERVVGLTIVAVGTSLPELATSVVAALRGRPEIAVGNVVGSNIFNALVCLGAAGLVGRVRVPAAQAMGDIAALGAFTLVGAVFLRSERVIRRAEGATLVAGYAAYIAWLAAR